jgi:signal transduction histidine kinase
MATPNKRISPYERLRRLQSVTDAALAHLPLEELLDEILDRIRDALEADTCAVLMLEEDRGELVARAARGLEEEVERGIRIPLGKGFAGRVAAERRPVVIADVDHADVLNPILREKGIRSLLGVPLVARGRVLGVVHVGTLHPHEFTPDEVDLLVLVAARVGVALERSLLHEELVKLDALKRDFMATAAHEVRTPASIIYGVAKTLAERGDSLDENTRSTLFQAFYAASERLARLTDDLLDFARLDAHSAELARERLSVPDVVRAAARGLSMDADEEIVVDVPSDLTVVADRKAVELIISNLVRNGIVHGAPPVSVTATADNGETRISVTDRGSGVAEAFVSRLFEPFSRADEATARPGAGLGLAIAQSYARQLGGHLVYEPGDGAGATFTLVLPRGREGSR